MTLNAKVKLHDVSTLERNLKVVYGKSHMIRVA